LRGSDTAGAGVSLFSKTSPVGRLAAQARKSSLGFRPLVCVLFGSADIVVLSQNIGLDLRRSGKGSRENQSSNETEASAGARGRFKIERPEIEC
jgi:hypothetical protein